MRTAMPSPNGTNRAGLYLTGSVADVIAISRRGLAYDSKRGLARDEWQTDYDAVIKLALQFAKTKMSESDLASLESILRGKDIASDEEIDQPPKFNGRPVRAGTPAMDQKSVDDFYTRFPMVRRIGLV